MPIHAFSKNKIALRVLHLRKITYNLIPQNIAVIENKIKLPKLEFVRFAKNRKIKGRIYDEGMLGENSV